MYSFLIEKALKRFILSAIKDYNEGHLDIAILTLLYLHITSDYSLGYKIVLIISYIFIIKSYLSIGRGAFISKIKLECI